MGIEQILILKKSNTISIEHFEGEHVELISQILTALVIYALGCILSIIITTTLPSVHVKIPHFAITMQLPETQPVDPKIKQLVERQANAWETADSEKPGSQFSGKEEIKAAAESYFAEFVDTTVTIKRIIVKGNEGAIEWAWNEKNKATGKTSQAEDAIIFELEDGKIKYWREYIDKESRS
jgi:ketosteroid isomerase-like protein